MYFEPTDDHRQTLSDSELSRTLPIVVVHPAEPLTGEGQLLSMSPLFGVSFLETIDALGSTLLSDVSDISPDPSESSIWSEDSFEFDSFGGLGATSQVNDPNCVLPPLDFHSTFPGEYTNGRLADRVDDARDIDVVGFGQDEVYTPTTYPGSRGYIGQAITIEQRTYVHPTKKGVTRYGQKANSIFDSISFRIIGENNDGISLQAALGKYRNMKLVGAEDLVLQEHGVNVILHILWPGHAPWQAPLRTKTWAKNRGPISREELAKRLATKVLKFIQTPPAEMQTDSPATSAILPPGVLTENAVILKRFYQVTKGGWQVEIAVLASIESVFEAG